MKEKQVVAWQRLEGLFIAIIGMVLYNSEWTSWLPMLAFILVPDVSMAGYLINNRVGAFLYNLGHSLVFPLLLLLLVVPLDSRPALLAASVWLVHIGFDRLMGFGLKHDDGFRHTHLGTLGKSKS